jgi:hypothetical protein
MDEGGPDVWAVIATKLIEHPDRDRVREFLLACVCEGGTALANFFQALRQLGDPAAVPVLKAKFSDYRNHAAPQEGEISPEQEAESLDFLMCCSALWKLDGGEQFRLILLNHLNSKSDFLRTWAEHLLAET